MIYLVCVFFIYTISGKSEQDSRIRITGTGTIGGNGKAVLNIQVEIEGLWIGGFGASVGVGKTGGGGEAGSEAKGTSTSHFNVQFGISTT